LVRCNINNKIIGRFFLGIKSGFTMQYNPFLVSLPGARGGLPSAGMKQFEDCISRKEKFENFA